MHYAPLPREKAGLAGPRLTALVAYMKGACHASFSTIRKCSPHLLFAAFRANSRGVIGLRRTKRKPYATSARRIAPRLALANARRPSRQRIGDGVVAHLAGLVGSRVRVSLEIEAEIPSGTPDHVVRTVTENGRTLKFTSQGFEKD
jgi:hypothetical protein